MRKNDKENKLTTNLVNGLYRYQGNSIVNSFDYNQETIDTTQTVNNNYICLGSDCSETSNDMYRIVGINEDGLLKVIKNTPAKEDAKWWIDGQIDKNWPESELYQYLNTEYYNALPLELKSKILNTIWLYGDVNISELMSGQKVLELRETIASEGEETAKKEAAKELAKIISTGIIDAESKNATSKIVGNISLMSITDYCSSFESDKELNCENSLINVELLGSMEESDLGISWLSPKKEWKEGNGWEWTMSHYGFNVSRYTAWHVRTKGDTTDGNLGNSYVARPVFFLTSDIELSGEGTIESPFTIGIE